MQAGYAMANSRPSSRSRKSTEALPPIDIEDSMRVIMVGNLIKRLDSEVKHKTLFTAYSDAGTVLNSMKSDSIANLAKACSMEDGEISDNIDAGSCAGMILLLLNSREEPNISKASLSFVEDSVDLNEFDGLFQSPPVKKMVDQAIKHYAACIKKKKIS